ncbi:MAG: C39 family peptidase [bacterium]|nr:MAG: C39 family peptidase [bacterium]
MRTWSRLIPAAAFLLSLAGTSCTFRLTDTRYFPEPAVRLAVESYTQEPNRCGPYALAAVLNFLNFGSDPEDLAERLYIPEIEGTLTMDLFLEAVRVGADAEQMRGSTERLTGDLERGLPVIILLRYGSLLPGAGHFVVITGYSLEPRGFFLEWGDGKASWVAGDDLDRMWARSDHWMLSLAGGLGS